MSQRLTPPVTYEKDATTAPRISATSPTASQHAKDLPIESVSWDDLAEQDEARNEDDDFTEPEGMDTDGDEPDSTQEESDLALLSFEEFVAKQPALLEIYSYRS